MIFGLKFWMWMYILGVISGFIAAFTLYALAGLRNLEIYRREQQKWLEFTEPEETNDEEEERA